MDKKPVIIDLFCGAGGAAKGYHNAGFEVIGVDNKSQENYPFAFILADAIDFIEKYGHIFNAIHASPPCQKYTRQSAFARKKGKQYPDFISVTRATVLKFNLPVIIENVMTAPVRPDLVLSGKMFGLPIWRHRRFEIHNWFCLQPGDPPPKGTFKNGDYITVTGKGNLKAKGCEGVKFNKGSVLKTWSYAMGIDWMKTNKELAEAIPPDYTEYIGKQLINFINQNSKSC